MTASRFSVRQSWRPCTSLSTRTSTLCVHHVGFVERANRSKTYLQGPKRGMQGLKHLTAGNVLLPQCSSATCCSTQDKSGSHASPGSSWYGNHRLDRAQLRKCICRRSPCFYWSHTSPVRDVGFAERLSAHFKCAACSCQGRCWHPCPKRVSQPSCGTNPSSLHLC
jgi:hypothetical protein